MRMSNVSRQVWELQDIVTFTQTPVVRNQWYTFFEDTTGWKKVYYASIYQDNDDVAAKNLQFRATIDGVTYAIGSTNVGVALWRNCGRTIVGCFCSATTDTLFMYAEGVECEQIKLEVRCTDAPGTNQELQARVTYGELRRV